MKPHTYSSIGIILGKRNLGEADKIIIILSKDFGKISVIAKGVRRPKSRKRGHLEIFNLINYQITAGHSMEIMTEAEVIEDFKVIRTNLKKVSLAYYFCEVVNKITNDGEVNSNLFNLLKNYLTVLKKQKLLKELRLNFIHELLIITGYHPQNEKMINHDQVLSEVIERSINSERVGKRMLQ